MVSKPRRLKSDIRRPDPERTKSRAASLMREEDIPPTRARRAARTLLAESDARTAPDPAPRGRGGDTVERRTSDLATPPPNLSS